MKAWFQARSAREQVLVTVLVLATAVAWLAGAAGRGRARLGDWRSAREEAAAQGLWLARQADIEAAAGAAVRNLDPARTYDATKLVATLSTLATGAGLTASIDPPRTERTAQFAFHTARVTLRRANLTGLLSFYDEVAKQAPYLSFESIVAQTDRGAPGALGVTMQISATQIAPAK